MQGVKDPAARDTLIKQVGELYEDGLTYEMIAMQAGVSLPTVRKYVTALLDAGTITQRSDFEMRSAGRQRYWDSPEGQEERRRRSELKRESRLVSFTCEMCAESFEVTAARAGHDPCRFCSRACFDEWTRLELASAERQQLLAEGHARWTATRRGLQAAKRAEDLLTLDEVIARLPRTQKRTRAAVLGHIADGGLRAGRDEFGQWWIPQAAIPAYVRWLENHRDGRLRRFRRPRFRDRWLLGRRAGELFRAGYSAAEAATELGYSTDYIEKVWRSGRTWKVTPAIQAARTQRRLLALIPDGGWIELRDAYRRLHMPAAQAEELVGTMVTQGLVEWDRTSRPILLRRVSQIPD